MLPVGDSFFILTGSGLILGRGIRPTSSMLLILQLILDHAL